ncbi:MAG: DUF3780 domain-containing protein [bacterium]
MKSKSAKYLGFGFDPAESVHHFEVIIPANKSEAVYISQHFEWDDSEKRRKVKLALGKEDSGLRVVLPRIKWQNIADEARADFNQRLKIAGKPASKWRTGKNYLARSFGKELTLLAWAIEDADPALIPVAIKNWLGLKPEERWWLYTMTNAATGHALNGRNKGWRKAVRYALTENPVTDFKRQIDFDFFQLGE